MTIPIIMLRNIIQTEMQEEIIGFLQILRQFRQMEMFHRQLFIQA